MRRINIPAIVFGGFILMVLGKSFFFEKQPESGVAPPAPAGTLERLTETISQSWLGQFISSLDLNNTTLGKPVVELVGATWAPVVLIIAAVALAAVVIWFIQGGPVTVLILLAAVIAASGVVWGIKTYVQHATSSYIEIDLRRVPIGGKVVKRVHTSSTIGIRVASSSRAVYGFTYTWACPNVDGSTKFVFEQGKGTNLHHFTIDQASRDRHGNKWVDTEFTVTLNPENPCAHLKEL